MKSYFSKAEKLLTYEVKIYKLLHYPMDIGSTLCNVSVAKLLYVEQVTHRKEEPSCAKMIWPVSFVVVMI